MKKKNKKNEKQKTKTKKSAPKKIVKKQTISKPAKKAAKPTPKKVVKKQETKKAVKKSPLKKSKTETKKTKPSSKPVNNSSKEKTKKAILPKTEKPKETQNKKTTEIKKVEVKKTTETKNTKLSFKVGEYAVYPAHGVGKIIDIEKTKILNQEFTCYLMHFEKEKLTIKIPTSGIEKIGMRRLVSKAEMDEVFVVLRSGIKKLKGMWSRRAQEYETKINSGEIMLLAEVLRDLTRDIEDSERSYSERIIYETAVYRLASEYAAIYGVDVEEAKEKVIITAKDKLDGEIRTTKKDDFDDFDDFDKDEDEEEDEEDEEDEDEEDDDFDYDDDEDEKPRKKSRK